LIANRLTEADVQAAELEADMWLEKFESEKQKLAANPELRLKPHWYWGISSATRHEQWARHVRTRYELQKTNPTMAAEVHVLRLGDVIFASVPFEYYLDYGVQVKVRSPAIQTFLLQLAGDGTYVPSPRSLAGGGYGSIAASNPLGHEGGQQLADYLVDTMRSIWT
ncbi:MAG: hypothetical protein K0Q59_2185, partial [Paenibacillus sp.]|nr:hypothetical protein [Paenibacillus sp.]